MWFELPLVPEGFVWPYLGMGPEGEQERWDLKVRSGGLPVKMKSDSLLW